jgi:hypothetical protein
MGPEDSMRKTGMLTQRLAAKEGGRLISLRTFSSDRSDHRRTLTCHVVRCPG